MAPPDHRSLPALHRRAALRPAGDGPAGVRGGIPGIHSCCSKTMTERFLLCGLSVCGIPPGPGPLGKESPLTHPGVNPGKLRGDPRQERGVGARQGHIIYHSTSY